VTASTFFEWRLKDLRALAIDADVEILRLATFSPWVIDAEDRVRDVALATLERRGTRTPLGGGA